MPDACASGRRSVASAVRPRGFAERGRGQAEQARPRRDARRSALRPPVLHGRPRIVAGGVGLDKRGHGGDVVWPGQRERAPTVACCASTGWPRPPRPGPAASVPAARRDRSEASAASTETPVSGVERVGRPPCPAARRPGILIRSLCAFRRGSRTLSGSKRAEMLELQGGESPVQHLPVGLADRVDQGPQSQHSAAAVRQRIGGFDVQLAVTGCRPRAPGRCGRRTPSPAPSPGWAAAASPAPAPARWCARRTPGAGRRRANHGVWQRYSGSAGPAPVRC